MLRVLMVMRGEALPQQLTRSRAATFRICRASIRNCSSRGQLRSQQLQLLRAPSRFQMRTAALVQQDVSQARLAAANGPSRPDSRRRTQEWFHLKQHSILFFSFLTIICFHLKHRD